jgi:hypothetical protein
MTNQATQILNAFAETDVFMNEARAARGALEDGRRYIERPDRATGELIAENVLEIVAVAIKKGFRIDAVMIDGSSLTIKDSSTRKPSTAQLHSSQVNGNVKSGKAGSLFTFSKISGFPKCNLKSYLVK